MHRTHRTGWWFVLMVACGGEAPLTGEWVLSQARIVSNECGFPDTDLVSEGSVEVRSDREGSTFFLWPDNADPVSCRDEGGVTSCADDTVQEITEGGATLTIRSEVTAVFLDRLTGEVSQTIVGDCTGPGCDLIAASLSTRFPCAVDLRYALSWRSEDLGVLATQATTGAGDVR